MKKIIYLLFLLPLYCKSQDDTISLKKREPNLLLKKETKNFAPIDRTLNPLYSLDTTKLTPVNQVKAKKESDNAYKKTKR